MSRLTYLRRILYTVKSVTFWNEGTFTLTSSGQDIPVILKLNNFQSFEKALNSFMEVNFCNSDFYFLSRRKKCVGSVQCICKRIMPTVLSCLDGHRKLRWQCAFEQFYQNVHFSRIQSMGVDEKRLKLELQPHCIDTYTCFKNVFVIITISNTPITIQPRN